MEGILALSGGQGSKIESALMDTYEYAHNALSMVMCPRNFGFAFPIFSSYLNVLSL